MAGQAKPLGKQVVEAVIVGAATFAGIAAFQMLQDPTSVLRIKLAESVEFVRGFVERVNVADEMYTDLEEILEGGLQS